MGIGRDRTRVSTRVSTWMPAGTPAYDTLILSDSPLVYLKLDETSGTTFADSSGNSRTYTMSVNAPTLNQTGPSTGVSKAALFDGSKNAAIAPTPTAFMLAPSSQWSISMWVRPGTVATTSGATFYFFTPRWSPTAGQVGPGYIGITRNGTNYQFQGVTITDTPAMLTLTDPTSYTSTTAWYHVAVVAESTNFILYVNGVQRASASNARYTASETGSTGYASGIAVASSTQGATVPLTGGQNVGYLSAIAYYNKALSSTVISNHYNTGVL